MNHNAFAAYEEMRRGAIGAATVDRKPPVFCPKPRRLGQVTGLNPVWSVHCRASRQTPYSDAIAGLELADIFLTKGDEAASSPPFFCGSPPVRAANPVVHDARFGEEKPITTESSAPMSPRKKCARAKFGLKPAALRVEGFDCELDRRSITVVA